MSGLCDKGHACAQGTNRRFELLRLRRSNERDCNEAMRLGDRGLVSKENDSTTLLSCVILCYDSYVYIIYIYTVKFDSTS